MSNEKVCLVLVIVSVVETLGLANNATTFILGGASKIYIQNLPESPLLSEFELFGCPGRLEGISLPSYPVPVFGASMMWDLDDQTLLVCGGANWTGPLNMCHSWR